MQSSDRLKVGTIGTRMPQRATGFKAQKVRVKARPQLRESVMKDLGPECRVVAPSTLCPTMVGL